jgi:opacity protein-like surface antigen
MNILHKTLRTALKGAGFVILAAALPVAGILHAQTDSTYNNPRTPRYKGTSWTDHVVLEGGGGGTAPVGSTTNFANAGFNVLLGTGFRFNNRLSTLAEWNFNRLTVPHDLAAAKAQTPDGNEHIWSATLNPKFDYARNGRFDGYILGGGGFSRALISFTQPIAVPCGYGYGYGYGFGYGYGACAGSVTVSHHSSNQGMLDAGTGVEFRFSPYNRTKLFLEARYQKYYTPKSSLPPGYDATLIPVTVGIRW